MRIRLFVRAALTAALLTTLVTTLASSLGGCGQRGALYIPGKPGDPYFDRQNRGGTGTSGTTPRPAATPNSTAPALPDSVPDSAPGLPAAPRSKREDGSNS